MVFEIFGRVSSSVRERADATVRLAASPELEGVTSRYFDGQRDARADEQAYDRDARNRPRRLSEEPVELDAPGMSSRSRLDEISGGPSEIATPREDWQATQPT